MTVENRKLRYSVCTDAVFMHEDLPMARVLEKVAQAGYDSIEFWSWWDKDIEEMNRCREALGLSVAAFCTKFINPGDRSLQEDYLEALKAGMEKAHLLGCPTLIAQAGWEFESFAKEITRKEHRLCLIDTMQKAGELAQQGGITLVLEPLNLLVNHPGYHLSTSEDAFDLIEKIGSPAVKILFDIYHQQITEGNLISNITEHIAKIGHFHAAANPGRGELTGGEIHYPHVLEAIAKTGYTGYVGLEYMVDFDPVPGLVRAREEILV